MAVDQLPTPPNSNNPSVFNAQADAFFAAWPTMVNQFNADIAALNLNDAIATSTTSLTVSAGTKNITTETNKSFTPGMALTVGRTSDGAIYMRGYVKSYNSTTGAMVFIATESLGAGTHTDWTLSFAAPINLFTEQYIKLQEIDFVAPTAQIFVEDDFSSFDDIVIRINTNPGGAVLFVLFIDVGAGYITNGSAYCKLSDGGTINGLNGYPIGDSGSLKRIRSDVRFLDVNASNDKRIQFRSSITHDSLQSGTVELIGHGVHPSSSGVLQGVRIDTNSTLTAGKVELFGVIK